MTDTDKQKARGKESGGYQVRVREGSRAMTAAATEMSRVTCRTPSGLGSMAVTSGSRNDAHCHGCHVPGTVVCFAETTEMSASLFSFPKGPYTEPAT